MIYERSLAIAGFIQHVLWAHRLAEHGEYREDRLKFAVGNILCTDPDSTLDVYGDLNSLGAGIKTAAALLGRNPDSELSPQDIARLTGYVGQVLKLATTLQDKPPLLTKLGAGLAAIKAYSTDDDESHELPVSELAEIYVTHISPLTPRIMIQGNGMYLQNEEYAAGIRTHLLAAIRSAILWKQSGGKLWQLFLQRRRYLEEFRRLQAELNAT